MKKTFFALSMTACAVALLSAPVQSDGKRALSSEELSSINGGGPIFSSCNSTSCPNAGTCVPNGLGGSIFYYNNLHTSCGWSWWGSCSAVGTAACEAKDHTNATCTAPAGPAWISSYAGYCA